MGGGGSKAAGGQEGIDGSHIAEFTVQYVGSVPVKAAAGADVAKGAIDRLVELKLPRRKVLVIVTTKGIYVVDPKTKDLVKTVPIMDISFTSAWTRDDRFVAFFENDKAIRLITAHTFYIAKNSYLLPVSIQDAFKALKEERDGTSPSHEGSQKGSGKGSGKGSQKGSGKGSKRSTSKKDALAAAVKVDKKEKGAVLHSYPCKYLGAVNVSTPKGDEVLAEAVPRIVKSTTKPVTASLCLHQEMIAVTDASGNELQIGNIVDVTFSNKCDVEGTEVFAYILHDRRLDSMTCIGMQEFVEAEDAPPAREAIDKVRRAQIDVLKKEHAAKVAKKGGAKPRPKEAETGRVIGTFEATYLGVVQGCPVKGQDVVEKAIETLAKTGSSIPEGVFISVSTEGIRNFESLTHEVLSSFVLKGISFTTVGGRRKDHFAFIEKDEQLGLVSCHIYKCAGERAFDIATAFGEAFKAYAEEQKRTGGNPFKASGEPEDVPESLAGMEMDRSFLTPKKAIGAGQFGQVWLAEDGPEKTMRAVKMLRGGAAAADEDEFTREAGVMVPLQHDNLVKLVGVSFALRPKLIILEFLPYGDLRNILKGCESKGITLEAGEMIRFAENTAAGMAFVAEQGLIHMDLAARNCLVGLENQCKIADFGLSRPNAPGKDYWQSPTVMKLPVKWCPSETLDERIFSQASDVWAFGVVMWEIASYGAMPYKELKTEEVQRKIRTGFRLVPPKGTHKEFVSIMSSCWSGERSGRPPFSELANQLKALASNNEPESSRDIGALLKA